MSPSRWRDVKEIAADALELPAEERSSHIAQACGGDPDLKVLVERLVAASDEIDTGPLDRPLPLAIREEPSLPEGTLLAGRFRVGILLARGGMGEVYRARHEELGEDLALKIISREIADRPGIVERFRHEVQRARRITHPNICRIHDLYSHNRPDGTVLRFLTMQLIAGPTLAEGMRGCARMPLEQALPLLLDLLAGLEAAHQAGIAHCDLKPSNILIEETEGQRKRAIISDFGLARALLARSDGDATRTGFVGGAPAYMAPELRFTGGSGVSGDIFAVGVIAYELLTGAHPFAGKAVWDAEAGFRVVPPRALAGEIPPAWEAAILRCIALEPGARFASVGELRSAIENKVSRDTDSTWWHRPVSRRLLPYAAAGVIAGSAGIAAYWRWVGRTEIIAVLPFDNPAKDASLDYLSDSITESLINSLSQLPRLHVPAVGLVRRFKGEIAPTKVGAALNAKAVLTGRVMREGDHLHVHAELIDVGSGRQLWGNLINRNWTNVLDAQESICSLILSSLQIHLGEQESKTLKRGLTTDEEAFQLYLRGQYLLGRRTEGSLRDARSLFSRAIDRDPKFALAYAGLASSRLLLGYFGLETPDGSMAPARMAAQKAIDLEPLVAEAHIVIGAVKAMFDWDWSGAEASFRRAIALKEDLAEAHHWYARFVLTSLGRHTEAIAEMKHALNSDPFAPILHTNLGVAQYFARRFDDAIAQLQKVVEMDPDFNLPYWTLGQAWAAKGNLAKAVEAHEIARRLQPGARPDVSLAYCYAICGKQNKGREVLDQVLHKYDRPSYSAYARAFVEAALGDTKAAFRSLALSLNEKEPQLIQIGADPKFDSIRDTSGYSGILLKMGLNPDVYSARRWSRLKEHSSQEEFAWTPASLRQSNLGI